MLVSELVCLVKGFHGRADLLQLFNVIIKLLLANEQGADIEVVML
jgi:hypothetical protein